MADAYQGRDSGLALARRNLKKQTLYVSSVCDACDATLAGRKLPRHPDPMSDRPRISCQPHSSKPPRRLPARASHVAIAIG